MCVRRKYRSTSSHAACTTPSRYHPLLRFTWALWAFAPFPLTMNICSSPGETSVLHTPLALRSIPTDSKALILPRWWDSSWDPAQLPPAHKRPSQRLSAHLQQVHLSTQWPAAPMLACFGYRSPVIPALAHIIVHWDSNHSSSLSLSTQDGFH